jgi:Zn-dependent protease
VSTRTVLDVIYLAFGFLFALAVHEYVHAWVASRLGDMTPRQYGRLTLDPRPHVDPFGTLILPGILLLVVLFGGFQPTPITFGYAKPQPLNPWALKRQDHHSVMIALAGPAANVLIAFAVGGLVRLNLSGELFIFLVRLLSVNVFLAAMNLMPIPPLDGARIVARFLPPRAREFFTILEQYGALFMLLIFFIISGPIFYFVRTIGNGICQITAGSHCLAG